MPDNAAKAVDSMGKVTEELVTLITKQIQDHGIVVWYDPEQAYGDVVDQLHLPETTVLRYQGSFFAPPSPSGAVPGVRGRGWDVARTG